MPAVDFILARLFYVVVTLAVLPLVLARHIIGPTHRPARAVLVSLTRFADDIDLHRRVNSPEALEKDYARPWVSHSVMLCVGDGSGAVVRLGRSVIGINIAIPRMAALARYMPRLTHVLRDVIAMAITARFIWRRRVAVVEVMSPSYLLWRGMVLRWLLPIRLVTQVRGNLDLILASTESHAAPPLRQMLDAMRTLRHKVTAQAFFRSCDLVIGYNGNNADNAMANGAHPWKTYRTRIRIDRAILTAPASPRHRLEAIPPEGRLILVWSRLAREKMVEEALAGALVVLSQTPDAHLVIIGDGDQRPLLEAIAKGNPVGDRVHFTGYRNRAYIGTAARIAHAVIVPYGGSALVEAALLERPVVAFDIEWHRELVIPGLTGWLVDFRNPAELAAALAEMLAQPEVARERARVLRQMAETMFDETRVDTEEAWIMGSCFPHARNHPWPSRRNSAAATTTFRNLR